MTGDALNRLFLERALAGVRKAQRQMRTCLIWAAVSVAFTAFWGVRCASGAAARWEWLLPVWFGVLTVWWAASWIRWQTDRVGWQALAAAARRDL